MRAEALYCLEPNTSSSVPAVEHVLGPGLSLALADDYARMVEDGWLLDDAESLDALMDACKAIEDRANGRG